MFSNVDNKACLHITAKKYSLAKMVESKIFLGQGYFNFKVIYKETFNLIFARPLTKEIILRIL